VQATWRLDRTTPATAEEVNHTEGHANAYSVGAGSMAFGRATTWQEMGWVNMQDGGTGQVSRWVTTHYILRNDHSTNDFLSLNLTGTVAGNAKAEDLHYARAASVVWGRIIERTAATPTPPSRELFAPLEKGGISAATVGELGTIDAELPIGDGTVRVHIPLTRVEEGQFAPYSDSAHTTHDVPTTIDEVDVLLGARIEADAEIQDSFFGVPPGISRNYNNSNASGSFALQFESRPAPGSTTGTPGTGTGSGGSGSGSDVGALARKWGCRDVRCNVYPVRDGARCPDRVVGNSDYIYNSFDDACEAAKRDANSQVPAGCNKRHCNCNTKCTQR
jgi:hypothetical protein